MRLAISRPGVRCSGPSGRNAFLSAWIRGSESTVEYGQLAVPSILVLDRPHVARVWGLARLNFGASYGSDILGSERAISVWQGSLVRHRRRDGAPGARRGRHRERHGPRCQSVELG